MGQGRGFKLVSRANSSFGKLLVGMVSQPGQCRAQLPCSGSLFLEDLRCSGGQSEADHTSLCLPQNVVRIQLVWSCMSQPSNVGAHIFGHIFHIRINFVCMHAQSLQSCPTLRLHGL